MAIILPECTFDTKIVSKENFSSCVFEEKKEGKKRVENKIFWHIKQYIFDSFFFE